VSVGDLTSDFALAMTSRMLWTAVYVCAPILGFSTLVGLAVSVLQAVTQIQEASIAFVLRLVTVVITLFVFGAWMLARVTEFARLIIGNIPTYF
jgi:flagellar biosynthesis protein FliQ